MLTPRSLRFRLTAWYALLLAAALALFSGLIWLSLRQRLIGDADRELQGSAARFEAYFRRQSAEESAGNLKGELEEFCQALPPSSYIELRGSKGFRFDFPPNRTAQGVSRTIRNQFTLGDETFTMRTGTSLRGIHRTLELLRILLLSLIPAVVAIACLGGAWLSRRALRPVDEITTAARTIGIENLSRRLPVPPTGDELARLTEVWNTMLARLESAVKTLSQFAADASHELRTPLAVIRTGAELALRRARSPESYRESLGEIAAEAERMTQLVEDLLFLARSDTQAAGMPLAPVDLPSLVSEVSSELRDLGRLRNIRVSLRPGSGEATVSGNRPALRRLFLVLLDNAIKYSREGGEVNIAIAATPHEVAVGVEDRGVGIGAADLPHIFQRFYRADKARTGGGHGLGLSLAATIAQAHGAIIEVESVEGEGALFTVRFPRTTLDNIGSVAPCLSLRSS